MSANVETRKPAWWLLYGLFCLMVVLLFLVEWLLPSPGAREAMDLAIVVIVFSLGAQWLRVSRAAILRQEFRAAADEGYDGPDGPGPSDAPDTRPPQGGFSRESSYPFGTRVARPADTPDWAGISAGRSGDGAGVLSPESERQPDPEGRKAGGIGIDRTTL